tara:strand:- start:135 stop:305 length:171 start_codon:yes stop_codon:yes gene_type:complete
MGSSGMFTFAANFSAVPYSYIYDHWIGSREAEVRKSLHLLCIQRRVKMYIQRRVKM